MVISQESSQSISSVRTWINIQNQNPDPLSSGHTMLSPCRISTQSSMQQNVIYQVATLPVKCKLHQGHKRLWAVLAGFPTPKLSSHDRHSVTISCMKSCHKSVSSLTQTDTERPIQSLDRCSYSVWIQQDDAREILECIVWRLKIFLDDSGGSLPSCIMLQPWPMTPWLQQKASTG